MISAPQKSMTKIQIEIIKTVLYFDVFKYPLTRYELFQNSAISTSELEFTDGLENLLQLGLIKELEGFILGKDRGREDIKNRLLGNGGAEKIMPTAYHYSRKISSFPFVEGICLSGALSKNYYDEKGDIDFFIITLFFVTIKKHKFFPNQHSCNNCSHHQINLPISHNIFLVYKIKLCSTASNFT